MPKKEDTVLQPHDGYFKLDLSKLDTAMANAFAKAEKAAKLKEEEQQDGKTS